MSVDRVGGEAGSRSSIRCPQLLGLTHIRRRTGPLNSIPCALMLAFRAEKFNPQICRGVLFHLHVGMSYTHLVIQLPASLY